MNLKLEWPQSSSGRRFETSLNRRGPRWRLLGSSSSPPSSGLRCSTVTGRELICQANLEKVSAKTLQCFQTWFISGGLLLKLEIKLEKNVQSRHLIPHFCLSSRKETCRIVKDLIRMVKKGLIMTNNTVQTLCISANIYFPVQMRNNVLQKH